MNSSGNVELVRRIYSWLAAGEGEKAFDVYHPDIEWDTSEAPWLAELVDAGDNVLAFVRVSARGRASGIEVTYEHPQLWTIRDGEVIRMRVFADRAAALQAAGLTA